MRPNCGAVLLHPRNGVPGQVQQTGSHVVVVGRGDPAKTIRAIQGGLLEKLGAEMEEQRKKLSEPSLTTQNVDRLDALTAV